MNIKRFTVTEDHLKLLRSAYVGWDSCEFGSPEIDCKRPFGNFNVYEDMAEILDLFEKPDPETGEYSDRVYKKLDEIYRELETVLQIVLKTGKFQPGVYEVEGYGNDWKRVWLKQRKERRSSKI